MSSITSSLDRFLSTPELWFNGVFNFLPFLSIQALASVNKHLRSFSRKITHPTHLGMYPIGFWSTHILPLLSYKDLKRFQRVSQVARRLTLHKRLSQNLFRSDVNLATLKNVKPGRIDSWDACQDDEDDDDDDDLPATVNPILGRIAYSTPKRYEDTFLRDERDMVIERDRFIGKDRCYIQNCMAMKENATRPAVPMLKFEGLREGHKRNYLSVVGTGRSFFGGKHLSVTCEDVMRAFIEDAQRYKCE